MNIFTQEKDIVATNRAWIKKKDSDLQGKKLINLQGHFHLAPVFTTVFVLTWLLTVRVTAGHNF